jgi:hypothetical protein
VRAIVVAVALCRAGCGSAVDDGASKASPYEGQLSAPAAVDALECAGAKPFSRYDVADRTKVAVVLADGIRDFNGDEGWGVVAWAQCDPAELPAAVTEDLGIGVWEDASGRRLPVRRVHSYQGPEHCSWTDITFLLVGPDYDRADWYVRDATGESPDLLRGTFDDDATLLKGATSTGWRRDGRELWLDVRQAAYLVDVDDPGDVERWPAAKEPIMCA